MAEPKLMLHFSYGHENAQPDKLLLTQALGAGKVADCEIWYQRRKTVAWG